MCHHRIHVEHQGGCGCLTGGNDFQLKYMLLVLKPRGTGFIHSFTHHWASTVPRARFLLSCVYVYLEVCTD